MFDWLPLSRGAGRRTMVKFDSDGQFVVNPTFEQRSRSKLDLVVAGTGEGVLMVESEAKELSEEIMLGAVTFGFEQFQPVIRAIIELAEHAAKDPWVMPVPGPEAEMVAKRLAEVAEADLRAAYAETGDLQAGAAQDRCR